MGLINNLWLTVPKGAPSSLLMSTFLITSATSQSSSFLIIIRRLGRHRSRPNQFVEVTGIKLANSWLVGRDADHLANDEAIS